MTRLSFLAAVLLFAVTRLSASITGFVADRDGAPVAGCAVRAFAVESHGDRALRLTTRRERREAGAAVSQAGGQFALADTTQPAVELHVQCDGFAPQSTRILGSRADAGTIAVVPVPMMTGRVTASGAPVDGAIVTYLAVDGSEARAITDTTGNYTLRDPAGWADELLIAHPSFAVLHATRDEGAFATTHSLERGRSVGGRVLASDGAPLAGARLFVDGLPIDETNGDGAFELMHVPNDARLLRAVHAAGAGAIDLARDTTDVEIRVAAMPRAISGTVVDALSRQPLGALELHLVESDRVVGSAVTARDGSFRFDAAPAGAAILSAQTPDSTLEQALRRADAGRALRLSAAPTATVKGRVVASDGTPIAGANVSAHAGRAAETVEELARTASAMSAPDGSFVLRGAAGSFSVHAARGGFAPKSSELLRLAPGETRGGVVLRLARLSRIRGIVRDDSGGIAAATLSLRAADEGARAVAQARSREGGEFVLEAAAGTYELMVEKDGYATATRHVVIDGDDSALTVDLERAAELSGRVVRAGNQSGVAGVELSIDGIASRAVTDAAGAFTLDAIAGDVRLTIAKRDELLRMHREVRAPDAALVIEIPQPRTLRGRVLDRASRKGVDEFMVEVRAEASGAVQTTRGTRGELELALPAEERVELRISAPDHVTATLFVERDQQELEAVLERASALTGIVSATTGEPLEDVEITLRSGSESLSARSDRSGRFVISGASAGRVRITLRAAGFRSVERELELPSNAPLHVTLERASGARGVVTDEAGGVIADALIEVTRPERAMLLSTTRSGADGRFTIDGLTSDGFAEPRVAIRASKPGYASAIVESELPAATEITLTLRRGASITGRVLGLTPQELARTQVIAAQAAGTRAVAVASDGSFVLDGLTAGRVHLNGELQSSGAMRTSEAVAIDSGDTGTRTVDIVFRSTPVISGRVTRGGAPVAGAVVRFVPRDPAHAEASVISDAAGAYAARGLSSGVYDVESGALYRETIRVSASAVLDINLP
jgi:hypothetical protein